MSQRAPDALAGARQGGGEQTGRSEVSVRCPLCDADRYRVRYDSTLTEAIDQDALDFETKSSKGVPLIDKTAHVRLASSEHLKGIEILRRGYNFTDGSDGFGHLDAGLFFIAFVRDPLTQFIPMQNALSRRDALNEYITPTSSALFACPPGIRQGDTSTFWGSTLFD